MPYRNAPSVVPSGRAPWELGEEDEWRAYAGLIWGELRRGSDNTQHRIWIPNAEHRAWVHRHGRTMAASSFESNAEYIENHARGSGGWPEVFDRRRALVRSYYGRPALSSAPAPEPPPPPPLILSDEERVARFPAAPGAHEGCECALCEMARRRAPQIVPRTPAQERYRAEYARSGRTFGVEIECLVPVPEIGTKAYDVVQINGWDRWIADSIRAGASVNCQRGNFNRDTMSWGVKHDGSLRQDDGRKRSPNGDFLVEVVSPPLRGEEGIRDMKAVLRKLVRMNAKVNVSCGFHLHVGAQDLIVEEVANVYSHFLRYERFFDLILPLSRRSNIYAYSLRNAICGGSLDPNSDHAAQHAILAMRKAKTSEEVRNLVTQHGGTDGHWAKLASYGARGSLSRYGTMEFRQHSGTVNETKAENWVRLCMAFFEKAYQKPADPFLRKTLSPGMEMARFFATFQPPRSVRAFYRERHAKLYADPHNDD